MTSFKLSKYLSRRVWEKLNETAVPVVSDDDFHNLSVTIDILNKNISTNQYFPDNTLGYLGLNKRLGVSRFLPILNHTDTAVYYHLCGKIGDRAIKDIDGVFGGWRFVPTPATKFFNDSMTKDQKVDLIYDNEYFNETFSAASWFQNYSSFTDCIANLTETSSYGNYVGITDIANFYDSIDVDRLITKVKRDAPDLKAHADILEIYLRHWNRRLAGYQRSNKGIPQEIISDGSRNLSHFYLHDFDGSIIDICERNHVKYVRWADDILFFGASTQRIEACLYEASKLLLLDGLNLSAPKTEIMSRAEFRDYRCLPLLKAISERNDGEFLRQIDLLRRRELRGGRVKVDTALRATISHLRKHSRLRTRSSLRYVEDGIRNHPEVFSTLNERLLLASIVIFDDAQGKMNEVKSMVNRKSMAAPKAYFLKLIREHHSTLSRRGIGRADLQGMIADIKRSSRESEILCQYCIPAAEKALR
ncbi:RNA-directed DNA polymerase [uncultured Nitratireductor sp.]|uniref:RNA-directed DNA polymerase n=1 Tax=uncultured Nitratireductor sp. TaxID=520953 RepID=UPI00260F5DF3|nr:RNA-directed DNA polymerase [uncultured Nitratireductor sp.]